MNENNTNWPTFSILCWGSFGAKTPEGRRFHNHFKVWLVLMAAGFFLNVLLLTDLGHVLGAILPGLAFTGIAWDFRRYLLSLDELARRIQVESIAWTYLTGLAVAPLLGGILVAYHLHPTVWLEEILVVPSGTIDAISYFFCFLLLEQARTIWLYVVSRKY